VSEDGDRAPRSDAPPDWALQKATEELYDVDDPEVVRRRAHEIARDERSREDERHTEWDDPDEGGEA
jgi:hypothetical protein